MAWRNKWARFWRKLNNPPHWVAALACITTFLLFPIALVALALDEHGHNVYAIAAGLLCLIPFVYAVYVTVIAVRRMLDRLSKATDKFTFTRNLFSSYEFRSLFFTGCTLAFNLGYTVFVCIMAIRTDSAWYGALAVYYILLVVARGGTLIQNTKDERKYRNDVFALHKAKVNTYRYCGGMMIALMLALSFSIVQMIAEGTGFHVPKWAIFIFGAVALYRIIMAALNFFVASKNDDLVVRSMRYLGMATAFVSVLSLQTAFLTAFPPSFDPSWLNALTGTLIYLIIMSLGIYMLSFSFAAKKKIVELETMQRDETSENPEN